jgi:hypothetical protein
MGNSLLLRTKVDSYFFYAHNQGAGKEAKLCFIGRALMENRNAFFVHAFLTKADGHAERAAACI